MHAVVRMMSSETFVAHVAGHAGIANERAHDVAAAVLSALGAYLTPDLRRLIADELPEPLADALRDTDGVAVAIDARVLAPGARAGRAHELVASVCRVLAEELSHDALRQLRAALPASVQVLLAASAPELEPSSVEAGVHETLATGRPGSRHPISEARAPERQGDSVAEANPHADSKLSSTRRER
jgi:uncharacterized protein (DUF2267 family)